jgi:glycine/D-amino acid oxidase-like deaminating enzyme
VDHDRLGYWISEAGGALPRPPLDGAAEADVLIVGGGFTGLWCAWYAKQLEPGARVVLLESEPLCGRGPSGRNGGFCHAMWLSTATLRARFGDAPALAVADAANDAVDRVEAFCTEQELDAWFHRAGAIEVSTAPAHDAATDAARDACAALGRADAIQPLTQAEVMARCASPAFRAGILSPEAATLQPARLALGLRDAVLGAGVEIHESSPVRSFAESPGGVEARTATGAVVRAARGVVAIGGAAKAQGGPLAGRLTVSSSHIVLTEPVPDLLEEIGWTGGEGITDSRHLVNYFRTTRDGRIAFGWGGGKIAPGARLRGRAEVDADVIATTAAHLRAYFPGLAGRRITHAWGGPIDVSPTHLPIVASLGTGRAFTAAGYTGNGVGPTNMVGRILASLALDRRDEHTRLALVDGKTPRVPPEPFHYVGGEAIRVALEAKEEAELEGRRPNPVAAAVAGVPKLMGFHIGR